MSKFYRTSKGHKAHASTYCANARRRTGSAPILEISAAELPAWAPCLHCCSAEQIAAWDAPVVVKPATCANEGIKHPGQRRLYSACSTCGKEGKVNRATGRIRAHAPLAA